MQLANAVVLITGANRSIGLAFAREALARGARRVYAAARDPASVQLAGVLPIQLDVTGLEAGADDVLADEMTRQVKQSLATASAAYLAIA